MSDMEVKTQRARRPSSMSDDVDGDAERDADRQRLVAIYAQRAKAGLPIFGGGTQVEERT